MDVKERYTSFEAFWPFYLQEHSKRATRTWHFVGSSIALSILIGAIVTGRWGMLALAPIAGYGFAWYSHFFIEKNRPATFTYPLWSLAADWKMWALMLTGRIDAELQRHVRA